VVGKVPGGVQWVREKERERERERDREREREERGQLATHI
jgi:hypothetical protein